jgi:3-oxoacyl-[acyl-carrier-protein] synthase III
MNRTITDLKKTVTELTTTISRILTLGPVNYGIRDIEYYLPEKVVSNEYLQHECGIDSDFLNNKVGIAERRVTGENEPTSEIAFKAAEKLLQKNEIDRSSIGLLMLCTQNPDYRLPTTACILQHKLKLPISTIAFDINLGCSGFTYGMSIAGNFIRTGIVRNALIIMADEYSKIINYKDKNTAALFGDAASAILLTSCEPHFGVVDQNYGTDGSGAEHLILYNSGTAKDPTKGPWLFMNGRKIIEFSMGVVMKSVVEILKKNRLKVTDVDYFIFHQANQFMLHKIQKELKIPPESMVIDMKFIGNTVSSTIPIAMRNLMEKKALKRGDMILMCGFGVGLSWGNVLYRCI